MSVLYSPEWIAENAVAALLQGTTAIQNIYITDTIENRVRPCLIVMCTKSEERKIGRLITPQGGYLSGVFNQDVQVRLEVKPNLMIQPSQNAMVDEETAKLWMQVWQAFHWDTLLSDRLTASSPYPFNCYNAQISEGEYSVNSENRIWQKTIILNLITMPKRDT